MPNPEQERTERIKKLLEEFQNKNLKTIDPIIQKASELYPYAKEYTLKSYATAVFKILESRKSKKEKKEAK
jgi:hypothetical protein